MTLPHTLSASIGAGGISLALVCPYAGQSPRDLASYPEWMRPVCRPAGATSCQASAPPLAVWGGPEAPLGDLAVSLWKDGTGFRIAAAAAPPAEPASAEDTARELAAASRSPRYHGENWRKLLESVSDVDYAWREAVRVEAHRVTMDALRAQLVDWHTRAPR